jgi:hypothetical protein
MTTTVANAYRYVDNDPLNKTDPLGLRPCEYELFNYSATRSQLVSAAGSLKQSALNAPGWARGAAADKVDQIAALLGGCRQLLKADPANDGRAIEVHGSLRTARHVGVHVAAGGISFANFSGFSLTGASLQQSAGPDTSILSWMDYNPPDSLSATNWHEYVFGRSTSEDGGESLARLTTILRRAGKDITLLGHSFAGTVVGNAVQEQGARPHRAVYVGAKLWSADASPGGVETYWGMASDDWIGGFVGGPPAGARVMSTQGVANHGDYWNVNNHGGRNVVSIIKGNTSACGGTEDQQAFFHGSFGCVVYAS